MSCVFVTIDGFLDWMNGFTDTLFTQLETIGNYSAIADLRTLQFTVTHALRFSVFTSRILATDFSQSHCNFESHMKSYLRRLSSFCSCQFRRLDSIQFLCSEAHIPAGWRLETRLTLLNWTLLYNKFAQTTQKTQHMLLRRRVYWSMVRWRMLKIIRSKKAGQIAMVTGSKRVKWG
jgi:hypothetical protein